MSLPSALKNSDYFQKKLAEKSTALLSKWSEFMQSNGVDAERQSWINARVLRQITEIPTTRLKDITDGTHPQQQGVNLLVAQMQELRNNILPSVAKSLETPNNKHQVELLENGAKGLINEVLSAFDHKERGVA